MDVYEAIKIIEGRILNVEQEHVTKKIIGYIYMQEFSVQDLAALAGGPDTLIQSFIQKAKTAILNPVQFPFYTATAPFSAPASYGRVASYVPVNVQGAWTSGLEDPQESAKLGFYSYPNGYFSNEVASKNVGTNSGRITRSLVDFPVKTCHYFMKGYCKHGNDCKFVHEESIRDPMFCTNLYEFSGEEQMLLPQSLEKLEHDITELLKSQGGDPISTASLPTMYHEKFGRTLQGEGYMTESQSHGKSGYSLTKLLARLKSIRLIDRPHGQHAVILAEDAQEYMNVRGERNDGGLMVSSSRQIYLTFPSESTFSEEEVSDYFSTFGPVMDVRIPSQQKRMFGFVTFASANTVNMILSEGNPHYVCGARVLVKPYREKSKHVEKNYYEDSEHPMYYQSQPIDIDLEPEAERQASWEFKESFNRQLWQRHLAYKLESISSPMDEKDIHVPRDKLIFPSIERIEQLVDNVLSNGDENTECPVTSSSVDEDSVEELDLPDGTLASAVPMGFGSPI